MTLASADMPPFLSDAYFTDPSVEERLTRTDEQRVRRASHAAHLAITGALPERYHRPTVNRRLFADFAHSFDDLVDARVQDAISRTSGPQPATVVEALAVVARAEVENELRILDEMHNVGDVAPHPRMDARLGAPDA